MKCDNCKHLVFESTDGGSINTYCANTHWYGDDRKKEDPEPEVDPWEDCEDFEQLVLK